jgi:hypothetical protein
MTTGDPLWMHWRGAEAIIDVRWPSFERVEPDTPAGPANVTEDEPPPAEEGRSTQRAVFRTASLGEGDCSGLDVTVTAGDAAVAAAVLDQVEMALVGPGGPLAPTEPLLSGTTTAEALPEVTPCRDPETDETLDNVGGPVRDTETYATPQEALGFYVATVPWYPRTDYEEIRLPDGSVGYTHRPRHNQDAGVVLAVHVVRQSDGWTVAAVEASSC